MPVIENKRLVREFYLTAFSGTAAANLHAYVSDAYVDHNAEQAGRAPDVLRAHIAALRMTFPDFTLAIEDMVAEGDKVATRVSGRGAHLGQWMGIAPSGRIIHVKGINIDRLADGRIVEHWSEADTLDMLVQMGIDPFAGRTA
jgi:predicted ester cyclase